MHAIKYIKLYCKTERSKENDKTSDERHSNKDEVCDDSDTCFQMIVCQAPFRSTERQGQHSHQSAYRAALIQYS